MDFRGVLPAITTPFSPELAVDHDFLGEHARRLVDAGAAGIVPLGSLGEGATLAFDEKLAVVTTLVEAVGRRVPIVPGIASLSTADACSLARAVWERGAQGLMVLPPYVYRGDWRETRAHVAAVLEATELPCILYNNPIAYGTDFSAHQVAELADGHPNLRAVKESSGDVRRISALRELLGKRLTLLVGLDDLVVEGVAAGAGGWIAGLVNALPEDSMRLFELAKGGDLDQAWELYRWFLPLLRLDTDPKFVQLIKLVQARCGLGSTRVRPPRLELVGVELAAAERLIAAAFESRR